MNESELKIGILFSLTGTTAITERGPYQASLLAIQQINESGGIHGRPLVPIVDDVASDPFTAARKAEKLITQDRVVSIVGLYTSACRKQVIPVLEKHDSLLFYPTFYEGSEQHPNIVYCGPLPNQQLHDFVPWLLRHVGRSFYLLGSDYIYPRETNRYIRRLVTSHGGTVVGEQYASLGEVGFVQPLDEIRRLKPDIVFSTLVGDSAIRFYQRHEELGLPSSIASTIMSETEFAVLPPSLSSRYYSCFPYFSSINSVVNRRFMAEYRRSYGSGAVSSVMENAYNGVLLLAEALRRTGTADTASIRSALPGLSIEAPQGIVSVDAANQHLWLHSRIRMANHAGSFDILWESGNPIEPVPDPELAIQSVLRNDQESSSSSARLDKHDQLLSRLKTALKHFPFVFGFVNKEGVLLETFTGGFGVIHNSASAPPDLMIPLLDHSGRQAGQLNVWRKKSGIPLPPYLEQSLVSIAQLCAELNESEREKEARQTMLTGIAEQLNHYLFVIRNGKVHYQNEAAGMLAERRPGLISSIMLELQSETPQAQERAVRVFRKEDGENSFEIKIVCQDGLQYVYCKALPRAEGRFSLKDRRSLTCSDLVGSNKAFLQTVALARSAAGTNANVLLLGESGTGKELFARAIHNDSARRDKPFVAMNCASISKELINAELFGYVEGAFTGAKRGGSPGKFEIANGGTLFLDEIGDMPIELQASLLRVLQEREVVRVGGHKPIPVDVRIIAATNRNLYQEIAYNGSFRSDLFYRLNVFTIELIPLRSRTDDIGLLADYYLAELSNQTGLPRKELASEAATQLLRYNWPGNIRELNNVMERAFYLADHSPVITAEHLPHFVRRGDNLPDQVATVRNIKQLSDESERQKYIQLLLQFKGNISRAARHLGISRTTLYRKLEEHRIQLGSDNT